MLNKEAIGLSLGEEVRRAERTIQAAMRDVAALTVSTIEASSAFDIGAALTHPALAGYAATMTELAEAHAHMARRAHPALERAGRFIGFDEVSWGGSGTKPPASAQAAEETLPHAALS